MRIFDKLLPKSKEMKKIGNGSKEYEEVLFRGTEPRKLKKIVFLYFLTSIMLVFTVCIIFLSGSVSSSALRENSFFGKSAERVVRLLTKGDFLCFYLSGEDTNQSDGGTIGASKETLDDIYTEEYENGTSGNFSTVLSFQMAKRL